MNIRKLFGGIHLTWPRVMVAAVLAGAFTAAMAILPVFHDTSFTAITTTFEVWILLGIVIIMNSRSNLDAALKCFVFFLISQPLIYLLQVPFSALGWELFVYYRYWFMWTVLCLPMGFIGYYMKKGKWWGYLILLPMIALTAWSYQTYFAHFLYARPRYVLIVLFCGAAMVLYPVLLFDDRRIRAVGAAIGGLAVAGLTVYGLMHPPVYSTEIMANGDTYQFDDSYSVRLEDPAFGDVAIRYIAGLDDYAVHADFKRAGRTVLILEAPDGQREEYDLTIERDTYDVRKK